MTEFENSDVLSLLLSVMVTTITSPEVTEAPSALSTGAEVSRPLTPSRYYGR